jgi:Bifunctional DNA primase/polymerase, N-terminal
MTGVFAEWAPVYRDASFWPRPIQVGTKGCFIKGWQRPDHDLSAAELDRWLFKRAACGIGLLMGSPFPDGTRLGAIDVDRDEYVRIAQTLLQDPPCGRIGSKGAVFFVRVAGKLGNPKFIVRGEVGKRWGKVVECLFERTLCVIPPTIHPSTEAPYQWIGTPLLEIDFNDLPIIGT